MAADYSVDELAAVAELAGLRSFPGTGGGRLAGERERLAARRALAARGTVRETADGRLGVGPAEWQLLGPALAPTAALDVEFRADGVLRRALVSWTRSTSVAQTVVRTGVVRFTGFPSPLLEGWISVFTGLDRSDQHGAGTVRVLRRGEHRIVGHELRWHAGPEGLRLVTDGSPVTVAQVRERIAALLTAEAGAAPGAA
jgi:hypothetical protein